MQKLSAKLLLVAACTGLILAGCNQKPAATPTTSTKTPSSQESTGSITIQESKDAAASMSITPAAGGTVTTTPAAALDAAAKATVDAGAMTPEAKKALEEANKALSNASVTTSTTAQ